jgi:rfaE bifunctional protein nucleotidyltransferase chain/domain
MKPRATSARDCVLPRNELVERLQIERQGKTLVFTNGCFDLLHAGHVRALEAARRLGDILVVGINADESVRRLKGNARPIIPETQRAELVAALKPVDYVVLFPENTPTETIRLLRPDVHVKSGDYRVDDMPETPIVRAGGGRVVIVPLIQDRGADSRLSRRQPAARGLIDFRKRQRMDNAKKTICFDLDGVLCSLTDGHYENAVPDGEAIGLVNRLHDRGCRIIIYTARFMGRNNQNVLTAYKEGYDFTRRQLQQWGVKFDDLILGKPSFDALIDDRAVFFEPDWRKIEAACCSPVSGPQKTIRRLSDASSTNRPREASSTTP